MEQTLLETSPEIEYPYIGDRVQSTLIDTLFIVVLMFAFSSILEGYDDAPKWIRITMFISIWLLYDPVCTSLGGTIGNYAKGLRVRQLKNPTKRINILQAVVRYLFKFALGWLSFMTINLNEEKRAIMVPRKATGSFQFIFVTTQS